MKKIIILLILLVVAISVYPLVKNYMMQDKEPKFTSITECRAIMNYNDDAGEVKLKDCLYNLDIDSIMDLFKPENADLKAKDDYIKNKYDTRTEQEKAEEAKKIDNYLQTLKLE